MTIITNIPLIISDVFKRFTIIDGNTQFPITSSFLIKPDDSDDDDSPAFAKKKSTLKAGAWAYTPLLSTKNENDIRVWQIGFDGKEIITVYGKYEGKMQISSIAVETKSKRSLLEQSIVNVNSRVNVRIVKDRYNFPIYDEDGKRGVFDAKAASEGVTKIDRCVTRTKKDRGCSRESEKGNFADEEREIVEKSGNRPHAMLAKDHEDVKISKIKFPAFVQPKLDGMRCLIDLFILEGKALIRYTSRGGKDMGHLGSVFNESLERLFTKFPYPVVLDGELVFVDDEGHVDFQATIAAVRKVKGFNAEEQKHLRFAIFGIYVPSKPSTIFSERMQLLLEAYSATFSKPEKGKIVLVPSYIVQNLEDVENKRDEFIEDGYEGAMLYASNGLYTPGKRSDWLVKYKKFDEMEGTVVGVEPGRGKEKDAAMLIVEVVNLDGKKVQSAMHPEGPLEERKKWLKNPNLVINKSVTFKHQGWTKDGIPRFAVAKAIRDYE